MCFYFFETSLMYLCLYFITFLIIIRNSCHCNNIFLTYYDFNIYILLETIKYIILFIYFSNNFAFIMFCILVEIIVYIYYIRIFFQQKYKVTIEISSVNTHIKSDDCSCSICLEDITKDKFITDCSHVFHKKCIIDWIVQIDINKKQFCPYCRTELNYSLKR